MRHSHRRALARRSPTSVVQLARADDHPILARVVAVYAGSSGDATKALYAELEALGPAGAVAVNVFRAQKTSERAKLYRGGNSQGRYAEQAYGRKQWSMDNLARELIAHPELGLTWGWARDPNQAVHSAILYLDLPTGQISWHTERRGPGPDYLDRWDEIRGAAPRRICAWVAGVLAGAVARSAAAT